MIFMKNVKKVTCQGANKNYKINYLLRNHDFVIENTKTDSRDVEKRVRPAVEGPGSGHRGRFAHQCRGGLGPNILID
jgi:hypothetical protein